jgi:signal transduction histidine kinase
MQGFLTFLLEDFGDRLGETGVSYVHRIIAAALQMDAFIANLLAYSRVVSASLQPEVVNLEIVFKEALAHVQAQANEAGAEIVWDGSNEKALGVHGALVQVFTNFYRMPSSSWRNPGARL